MISLEGMYDMHLHPAPSVQRRRFTSFEALKFAHEEKMMGICLLDHCYNTTQVADTINEMGLTSRAYGVIMLNEGVGGINPSVVEIALAFGTKQIQMPTYSSRAHYEAYGDDQKIFPYKKRAKPAYILDDAGKLINEVEEILLMMKDSNAFLGTGHLSPSEIDVLVNRAKERKVKVLLNTVSTDMPGIPLDAQKKWASDHVFMEHVYMAITDVPHESTPISTVVEQIHGVGAERCVLGTDAGNMRLPDNVTAMKDFVTRLLDAGITGGEIDVMTRKNPKLMLG
jgi:hypothetical protein